MSLGNLSLTKEEAAPGGWPKGLTAFDSMQAFLDGLWDQGGQVQNAAVSGNGE